MSHSRVDLQEDNDQTQNTQVLLLEKLPLSVQQENYEIINQLPEQMDLAEIINMIQLEFPSLPHFNSMDTIALLQKKKLEDHFRKIEEAKLKEEASQNKNANKSKPTPKQPAKDKEPKREIIWEPVNPVSNLNSHEHMLNHLQGIQHNSNLFQEITQSISFSHIQAAPVLLPEILYPLDLPRQVQPLIESTILFFTQQNYFSAFQNLEKAQQLWLQTIKKDELGDDTMLFFEYFTAQIYETAGQDEAAMNRFMKAKYHSDRLVLNHPDRALPFCGFGSVLYHLSEYTLSLRAFMKAKQIRDECIGSENVENAIIYNNMGCCLHQMTQFFDAETCYQFAEAIFDIHLGCYHEKTLNVKRNLQKLQKDRKNINLQK